MLVSQWTVTVFACSSHQYLARRLDALAETQKDDAPGEKQTQQQLPFHIPQILYPLRLIQNIIPAKKKANVFFFFQFWPRTRETSVHSCSSVSFLQQDSKSCIHYRYSFCSFYVILWKQDAILLRTQFLQRNAENVRPLSWYTKRLPERQQLNWMRESPQVLLSPRLAGLVLKRDIASIWARLAILSRQRGDSTRPIYVTAQPKTAKPRQNSHPYPNVEFLRVQVASQ